MFINSQFEPLAATVGYASSESCKMGENRSRANFHRPRSLPQRPQLQFEFKLTPLPTVMGDYNGNNVVDAADYALWPKARGTGLTSLQMAVTAAFINQAITPLAARFGNPLTRELEVQWPPIGAGHLGVDSDAAFTFPSGTSPEQPWMKKRFQTTKSNRKLAPFG